MKEEEEKQQWWMETAMMKRVIDSKAGEPERSEVDVWLWDDVDKWTQQGFGGGMGGREGDGVVKTH